MPANPESWAVTLDLTGATLVDFNAAGACPRACQSATLAGTARFTGARFADVDFRGTARCTDVTSRAMCCSPA
ncbi:hypothetical protein LZG04_17755 [Saccharothrix sp. S26]|uniref:hypothetical protein n=1 Tax=Saccharothrix sp. S26 TaxID=2907215 RepID=UPI001F1C416C|nr:hypothetical protein [Saccharothrix sp. S26]MCE6996634.1 hypothetical protein [Saccharothrix sp. S26]